MIHFVNDKFIIIVSHNGIVIVTCKAGCNVRPPTSPCLFAKLLGAMFWTRPFSVYTIFKS